MRNLLNIGGSCCCCLSEGDYSNWTLYGDCCRICDSVISEAWTVLCSAAIRTDNRSATGIYTYYAKDIPFYEGEICLGDLVCELNTDGSQSCTADGVPLPTCADKVEALCTTVTEVHTVDTVHKLVSRYRRVGMQTTITKVNAKCDAEETATCKWLVISKLLVEVQWAQVAFIDRVHTITASSGCCTNYSFTDNATAPSCATRAAAGLSNSGVFALTRAKYYTSAPSGVITFNPGDTVACIPLSGACESIGSDDIVIVSTDPGAIAWTAPVCVSYTENRRCGVVIHCINLLSVPPYDECSIGLMENYVYTVRNTTGDLLTNPTVLYVCTFSCGTLPARTFASGFISREECALTPSPSRTDSGYTARSINISYPAWTVDLDATCAA